jgi:uncharacterized protein (TIGR03000 family)
MGCVRVHLRVVAVVLITLVFTVSRADARIFLGVGFGRGFASPGYYPGYYGGPGIGVVRPVPTYPYYTSPYDLQTPLAATELRLSVRLPADALVWVNRAATTQTGGDREYITSDLEPGKTYVYEIKARWMENGKPVEKTKRVSVRSGERYVIDFAE